MFLHVDNVDSGQGPALLQIVTVASTLTTSSLCPANVHLGELLVGFRDTPPPEGGSSSMLPAQASETIPRQGNSLNSI